MPTADFRAGLKIERYKGDGTEFDSLRSTCRGRPRGRSTGKRRPATGSWSTRQFRAERNHQIVLAIDTGHLMCEPLAGIPKARPRGATRRCSSPISPCGGRPRGARHLRRPGFGLFVEPKGGLRGFNVLCHMAGSVDYSDRETNLHAGPDFDRPAALAALADRGADRFRGYGFRGADGGEPGPAVAAPCSRFRGPSGPGARRPRQRAIRGLSWSSTAPWSRAALLRDREVVLRRLRRLGIYPIDAAPAQVSTRLINTYLDIKRRERI